MRRAWKPLKRRADFLRAAASGLRRAMPAFIVQAVAVPADGRVPAADLRIGFTVSRKVGNAVARNRAKRRLRAAVDIVIGERDLVPGLDYVVIGRREALTRDFAVMTDDLRRAFTLVTKDGRRTPAVPAP